MPVHSPLLGHSPLLSLPPPNDMLKLSRWLRVAQVIAPQAQGPWTTPTPGSLARTRTSAAPNPLRVSTGERESGRPALGGDHPCHHAPPTGGGSASLPSPAAASTATTADPSGTAVAAAHRAHTARPCLGGGLTVPPVSSAAKPAAVAAVAVGTRARTPPGWRAWVPPPAHGVCGRPTHDDHPCRPVSSRR